MSTQGDSSGHSDAEVLGQESSDSSDEEIEYKYDNAHFAELKVDQSFVSKGAENWDRVRAEWTKNAITGEDSVLNNDLDLSQIDVEQTMICLQTSKPFPQNVSLSTIVEILNVLWDDGGVQ